VGMAIGRRPLGRSRRRWVENIKIYLREIGWDGVDWVDLAQDFLFSTSSTPALGPTHLPIKWVPGVKRPRREGDHSPPTTAEVKKIWNHTSTPHTPSWYSG
jgi:hypothetical protein